MNNFTYFEDFFNHHEDPMIELPALKKTFSNISNLTQVAPLTQGYDDVQEDLTLPQTPSASVKDLPELFLTSQENSARELGLKPSVFVNFEETKPNDDAASSHEPTTNLTPPSRTVRPTKINFNLEGSIKKVLGIFKKQIRSKWETMWLEQASSKSLSSDKPYYYHSTESKEASVKYFFTEYENGFLVPREIYDRNKDFFLYILSILQKDKKLGSLECIHNCLSKCPTKKNLVSFFQNEAIVYLWWNSRQSIFFNSDLMNNFLKALKKDEK